jgi:predicted nucleic-acid-binding protein
MIALDTNVVVRLLIRDDPAQADLAAQLVRGNQVLLTTTVLLETEWVLRSRCRVPRSPTPCAA